MNDFEFQSLAEEFDYEMAYYHDYKELISIADSKMSKHYVQESH